MHQTEEHKCLGWLQKERKDINKLLTDFIDTSQKLNPASPELHQALFNPLREFLLRGGKRIRPIILRLCYSAVGGKEDLGNVCLVPELIHTGTLIIDDIEDNSSLRRGKPTLHTTICTDLAINAGNYLYFSYHPLLKSLPSKTRGEVMGLITSELSSLHLGQGLDISWHHGKTTIPSAEEYTTMCRLKTGTLMRLSAKIGALLGGGTQAQIEGLGRYAEQLGVAFQIRDDILNVRPTERWGKEHGEDIHEGKRTLLVIRAAEIASEEDKQRLQSILDSRSGCREDIECAISLFEKYDCFSYAEKKARSLVEDSLDILRKCISHNEARDRLEQLGAYFISRRL